MVIEFGKNEVKKWLKHGINPIDTVLRMWLILGNGSKKMYFVEE
jgi:ribosomal protein S16